MPTCHTSPLPCYLSHENTHTHDHTMTTSAEAAIAKMKATGPIPPPRGNIRAVYRTSTDVSSSGQNFVLSSLANIFDKPVPSETPAVENEQMARRSSAGLRGSVPRLSFTKDSSLRNANTSNRRPSLVYHSAFDFSSDDDYDEAVSLEDEGAVTPKACFNSPREGGKSQAAAQASVANQAAAPPEESPRERQSRILNSPRPQPSGRPNSLLCKTSRHTTFVNVPIYPNPRNQGDEAPSNKGFNPP